MRSVTPEENARKSSAVDVKTKATSLQIVKNPNQLQTSRRPTKPSRNTLQKIFPMIFPMIVQIHLRITHPKQNQIRTFHHHHRKTTLKILHLKTTCPTIIWKMKKHSEAERNDRIRPTQTQPILHSLEDLRFILPPT